MRHRKADPSLLHSISHACSLLHCFSAEDIELGVSELATRLRMRKSGVHRLLQTLVEYEFIRQRENRKYVLGKRLVRLSEIYRSRAGLLTVAKPILQALATSTGKTSHIAKLYKDELIYLLSVRPRHAIHFTSFLPSHASIHCTALGKVLLAYLPAAEQDRIVKSIRFERKTPNTIVGVSPLKAHLELVRVKGYAIDNEESTLTLRCVAAPIWNYEGTVEAALSLSGHAIDLGDDRVGSYIEQVKEAASNISAQLRLTEWTNRTS